MASVFVIAGEASGDQLGAGLLRELKLQAGSDLTIAGIGGDLMAAEGLVSLFPMHELSVMGIAEVLPKVPQLLRRVKQTVQAIIKERPEVLVTIDAPGFTFRVAKQVKAALGEHAPKMVHYVAPTVWAWKPGRAKKIAQFLDHLLVLLPFEPPYFEQEGLATTFVGHPVTAFRGEAERFRAAHGVGLDQPVLAVLPGSRRGELKRLVPVMRQVLDGLSSELASSGTALFIPTLPAFATQLAEAFEPYRPIITTEHQEKWDGYAVATSALVASGTATLELAVARAPAVVAYRMNPLTAAIVKRMTTARYAGLVNILADQALQPEFLQDRCLPDLIVPALRELLIPGPPREAQLRGVQEQVRRLTASGGASPSAIAARKVMEVGF